MSDGLYTRFRDLEEKAERVLSDIAESRGDSYVVDFADPLSNGVDHTRIPTKIKIIDELLRGGLGRGEIGIIMARFGHGKSTLLSIFGFKAFLQGYNVLHLSYEDVIYDVKNRYKTMMDHYGVVYGDRLNSVFFVDCVSRALEIPQIQHILEVYHVDVVLVDYLDVVPWGGLLDTDRKRLKDITVALKRLAGKNHVALWTATQATIEKSSSGKEVTVMNATRITESKVGKGGTTDVLLGVSLIDHIPNEMEITYIKGRGRKMPNRSVHRIGFDPDVPRVWSKYAGG